MPTASKAGVSLEDSGEAWALLTTCLEALIAAWDQGGAPPRLGDFIPEAPASVRRLIIVELVKVDLEYRWSHGTEPRRIEEYLAEFPELSEGGAPCDLLYEEFHVRKRAGDNATPDEYFARFPAQADELGRLLGLASPETSTMLYAAPGPEQPGVGASLDDFDLLAEVGKGAFATVYLARQRSMQRLVALKVSADRGAEPQTLAQLDHPHIVRVYDQRVLADRGLRLLYMQYIAGGTLQPVIARARKAAAAERSGKTLLDAIDGVLDSHGDGPAPPSAQRTRLAALPWPETVCWLGLRLADALAYAAEKGVLHRDVKPANVLLAADGSPKLADFNISFGSKLDGASPAAFFGGSLAYMSPEHLDAFNPEHPTGPESLDARSDLYSLGVLLWEMLVGRRPFPEEKMEGTWPDTLKQMAERRRGGVDVGVLTRLSSGWPPGMIEALLTCLAPDPAERFASGHEAARHLALCLHPRTQRLLQPAKHGWRTLVARFPTLCLVLAVLLPNLLASLFNFAYNRSEIVAHLGGAGAIFWNVQMSINGTAYPIGIAVIALLIRSVLPPRATPEPTPGARDAFETKRRARCLMLGHYCAGISLAFWLVAGIAYPIGMSLAIGSLPLSPFLHFVGSLGLCGLIAAVYPFFGVTFFCGRVLYPPLLRSGAAGPTDLEALAGLHRLVGFYVWLAAAVPMLAVMALVVIGSESRLSLGVLSAAGLAGFGLAFWLARAIQDDLQALAVAARPPGEAVDSSSGSFGSAWSNLER